MIRPLRGVATRRPVFPHLDGSALGRQGYGTGAPGRSQVTRPLR